MFESKGKTVSVQKKPRPMQALFERLSLFDRSTFKFQSNDHGSSKSASNDFDELELCNNDDVIRIEIENIDRVVEDLICVDPSICIRICNVNTGKSISSPATIGKKALHTIESAAQSKICSSTVQCDETVIIQQKYHQILDQNIIVFFEVLDCLHAPSIGSSNACNDNDLNGATRIAWGFLKPIGKNGTVNIGTRRMPELTSSNNESKDFESTTTGIHTKRCRLQLFNWQHDSRLIQRQAKRLGLSPSIPLVFLQYLRQRRRLLRQSLSICIGPHQNVCTRQALGFAQKPGAEETNHGGDEIIEHQNQYNTSEENRNETKDIDIDLIRQYSRFPDSKCMIPDRHFLTLNYSGATALAFSHSGNLLAVASNIHQLCVHDLCTGEKNYVASYRHHGVILDLSWSLDDSIVACTSKDGTISVHRIEESMMMGNDKRCYKIEFVEPPSYPRVLAFHPFSSTIPVLIIGSSDGKITLWNLASERKDSNLELLGEKICHQKAVNAITCDGSNGRVYTGDDEGNIIIWRPKSESIIKGSDFEVLFQLRTNALRALSSKPILNLSLRRQSRENRDDPESAAGRELLITIQGNNPSLFVYDLADHELTNFCIDAEGKETKFRMANFSPDEKYVVGGTEDGKVMVMDSCGIRKKVCRSRRKEGNGDFFSHLFRFICLRQITMTCPWISKLQELFGVLQNTCLRYHTQVTMRLRSTRTIYSNVGDSSTIIYFYRLVLIYFKRCTFLDDSYLVSNIKSIMVLAELDVSLLSSLGGDKSVDSVSLDGIKLLYSILDLTLVALDVNNEDKGVGILDQLHGGLSGQGVLDDRELVKDILLGGRLLSVLGYRRKVYGLSTVEMYLVVDTGSLLGYRLGELLSYC